MSTKLPALFLLWLPLACASAESSPRELPRPNLVLIIADDVSADDIGCYGNPGVRTPRLDELARQGRQWTRAYLTATVCSPSRCSIITGRYPHNTGAAELHIELPEGQPLFPLELRKEGYWCAQSGKWHLGDHPKEAEAFDRVVDEKETTGESGCEFWVPLLKERPKDRPFFLWLAAHDAHRKWQPDPEGKPHDPAKVPVPEPLVDTPTTREDLAGYYNEIQRLDRYVGKVVDELAAQEVLDNTLILFISDNGRPFPRAKRWTTEAGSRTPWILHWPAGLPEPGTTCRELTSTIDIAPTFLELAEADIPEGVQGRSFLPQIRDPEAQICEYVFAERNWQVEYCHERMVRHGSWAYYRNAAPTLSHFGFVSATFYHHPGYEDLWNHFQSGAELTPAQKTVFLDPRPTEQLFNLELDPLEVNDLAGHPSGREMLEKLRRVMDRWIRETGDTVPPPAHRTPDRHDRKTGERFFETWHPGPKEYVQPGQSARATKINHPGPR